MNEVVSTKIKNCTTQESIMASKLFVFLSKVRLLENLCCFHKLERCIETICDFYTHKEIKSCQ
jgi:hypothetical protein